MSLPLPIIRRAAANAGELRPWRFERAGRIAGELPTTPHAAAAHQRIAGDRYHPIFLQGPTSEPPV